MEIERERERDRQTDRQTSKLLDIFGFNIPGTHFYSVGQHSLSLSHCAVSICKPHMKTCISTLTYGLFSHQFYHFENTVARYMLEGQGRDNFFGVPYNLHDSWFWLKRLS